MANKQEDEGRERASFSPDRGDVPLRVSLIVLAVIVAVFSAYEIVERTWLTGADMEVIHLLHIVRGVGTSLLVAIVVGWYLLRVRPFVFPSRAAESAEVMTGDAAAMERLVHLNRWFIRMRWVACMVSVGLVAMTIEVLHCLEGEAFAPLIGLIALLALSNVLYTISLRRGWRPAQLPVLQMGSDLLILTAMLHYSGGIENPLSFAYLFHVIIGGIVLDRRTCYGVVALACVLFTILALGEMTGHLGHYTLLVFPHPEEAHAAYEPLYVASRILLQVGLLGLTAYFTTAIVDQLRAEEKRALAHRQRLESVVEATEAGLAILDRDLRPVWVNDQLARWLDLPEQKDEEYLRAFEQWSGGKEGPAARTLEDGVVRVVERSRTGSNDGRRRTFQVTVAALADRPGQTYEVVELTQDITHRKMVEAEMTHAGKMAALGSMAAGIAHEVGNPLASITTRLDLMAERHDEAFVNESLPLLQNQIARIERIVRGVSQFARPSRAEWVVCRINDLVTETLGILRLHRATGGRGIQVHLAQGLPDVIGARDQLIQVFLNLGLNAMEAMSEGGELTVETYADDGEVGIKFADTGAGIDSEAEAHIFDPFFSTKQTGSGLGLWFVKSIVDAHGGRITVESRPGAGASFAVALPIGTQQQPSSQGGRS